MKGEIIKKIFHDVKIYDWKNQYVGLLILATTDEELEIMPQSGMLCSIHTKDQRNLEDSELS